MRGLYDRYILLWIHACITIIFDHDLERVYNTAAAAIGNADTSVDTDKTTRCFGNCHEGCYEYDDKLRLNTRKYVKIGAYGSRFPICRTNEMPYTKF